MLECGLMSRLWLEFSGFSMWHFLMLVVRGFLRVLWFPPLSSVIVSAKAKINAISALSNLIAELSLRTAWHTTYCTWWAPLLYVIFARLHSGHLGVPVGDSSLRSKEIVKKSRIAPFNPIIIIIITTTTTTNVLYHIISYHITLYYIILYYIILYYIILYYIILYYITLHYIMSYYFILYYIMLCYVILCYIILYYIISYIIFYYIILHCIILYYIILYYTILYYIILYYIILYYIILYYIITEAWSLTGLLQHWPPVSKSQMRLGRGGKPWSARSASWPNSKVRCPWFTMGVPYGLAWPDRQGTWKSREIS